MSIERKQIFAHLTISANIRDFDRLGEVNEFIHEVAEVLVDSDARSITIVKKESIPIGKDDILKLIGVDGLHLAQQAAEGAQAVDQMALMAKELEGVKAQLAEMTDKFHQATEGRGDAQPGAALRKGRTVKR